MPNIISKSENTFNFNLLKLEVRDAIIVDLPGLKKIAQGIDEEMP